MNVTFAKYQATGNDFVILDNRKPHFDRTQLSQLAAQLCDRHFGVGADGLLVLQKAQLTGIDFEMIYFNADGSYAGMCGNGSRCLCLFAFKNGFGNTLSFHIQDQIYRAEIIENGENNFTVNVSFPLQTKVTVEQTASLPDYYRCFTGSNHVILHLQAANDLHPESLTPLAKQFRFNKDVNPDGVNVNFCFSESDNQIQLLTYERGVEDFTLSCGTGAIASALVQAEKRNFKDGNHQIKIKNRGGNLSVSFEKATSTFCNIVLGGPASEVFIGQIPLATSL